jgi:hypothetical protein
MSFRSAAFLAAMLTTAPLGLLAAQQAAAPTSTPPTTGSPVAGPPAAPAEVTPAAPLPQPQYSPLFQKGDSAPTLGTADNANMAAAGKSHTIVISTLVLVLAIVILVLLIF